jgi:GntR family transcriptional regulator/MocR family aminotransferase
VEAYGLGFHRELVAAAGLEVVALPVDAGGADVTALDDAVDAVLLTPAHQFPTGVPLAAERRRAVVAWAQRTGATVLEDDYDGEFRYDRRAVGALQALDPQHVVYLGTASKALAPAIGLGWAVPPPDLLGDVLAQRELSGGQPAALQQLALAAFLEGHAYDRNVRRLRGVYRARRARLEEVVADALPGCEVTGLPAGLHGVLRLPAGAPPGTEDAVVRTAAARGVLVEGLSALWAPERTLGEAPTPAPAVVVGFGGPTPGQYERALSVLVESVGAALGE